MNKRTLYPLKALILSCILAFCMPVVQAAEAGGDDALLKMIPDDCSFCLRINNFSGSMGKLDTYLAGISPMPLAMLVNMQLAGIVGDPMLGGLDMTGDVVVFVLHAPEGSMQPIVMGVMIPVTDFDEFVNNNPNCAKGADNIAILSSANSPVGNLAMMPVPGNKHALVLPEAMKMSLAGVQKTLMTKSAKNLSTRLNASQLKQATSAPLFAYVNIASLYDRYEQDVLDAISQIQAAMPEEAGPAAAAGIGMYAEMFKAFAGDADSATLVLDPEANLLKLDFGITAKDGSELASMLVADPKAPKSFKLGGYLDEASAINALMKVNRPMFEKLNTRFLTIMETATDDPEMKKQNESMKSLLKSMMEKTGNEISVSFSYAAGMPPITLREVIEVKGDDFFGDTAVKGLDYANTMYKAMDLPMTIAYNKAIATHNGVKIDSFNLKMEMPTIPDEEMTPEAKAAMAQMAGMSNFSYYVAQTGGKALIAMGQDGQDTIKSMIDQGGSGAVPTDFKMALETLDKTPYSDFVCSVNMITLMKGLGEMMASMGQQGGMPMPNIFGKLNVESKSSMAIGGYVDAGSASVRVALPKQHLMEIFSAAMQIQQQAMAMQMEMQQQMQEEGGSGMGMEQQNPLTEWVGKPSPDIKMVDLQGKVHRVSGLKGKKVILDFWATWCPPCKEAIPHLIELRKSSKESDLVIVGLSDEPIDRLNKFVKENKINYPIVSYNEELPAPYGKITGLPTMFLIDSKGIIQDVLVGFYPPEDVQARLNKLQ